MVTSKDPTHVLPVVSNVLATYRRALVSSLSFADTLMGDLPPDGYTWATLVRYWAWQEIKQTQAGSADLDWKARRLACNGMELECGAFRLRPFKSIFAGPPAPGHSEVKRDYYRQRNIPNLWQGSLFDEPLPARGANLIIDWSIGAKRDPIIALSKPKGLWPYRGNPDLEWRITIRFGDDSDPSGLRFKPSDDESDWDFRKLDRTEIVSDGSSA